MKTSDQNGSDTRRKDLNGAPLQSGEPGATEPKAPERRTLSRHSTDGHQLLNELRGQPGFGVLMTSTPDHPEDMQVAKVPQSLGQRLNHELDLAVRRERQMLELIDLANRPARELTPDQFRRLLEAIS